MRLGWSLFFESSVSCSRFIWTRVMYTGEGTFSNGVLFFLPTWYDWKTKTNKKTMELFLIYLDEFWHFCKPSQVLHLHILWGIRKIIKDIEHFEGSWERVMDMFVYTHVFVVGKRRRWIKKNRYWPLNHWLLLVRTKT